MLYSQEHLDIWFSQVVLMACTLDDAPDEPYWEQERENWRNMIAKPWGRIGESGWRVGAADDWLRLLLKETSGPATILLLQEMLKGGVIDMEQIWHPEVDGLDGKWKADFPLDYLEMTDMARHVLGLPANTGR